MRARCLPWLILCLLSSCAISHSTEEGELVGRFRVLVDVAESGEADVRVEEVPLSDSGASPKATVESVLTRVSVVGPGSWDAATNRISATVRVTNVSAPAMDEPFLVVRTVTQPSSCVIFEGAHAGGTYVGAQYRYADITAPGATAVNGASAKQRLVIHAPCVRAFTFTVDVRAGVRGSRRIVPDRDDDGYNIEPEQAAGDDCNDTDPSVYPGGPVPCSCGITCGSTCGMGCCDEVCSTNCSRTCLGGCVCDVHPGPAGSGANPSTLDCQAGSICNLDCAQTASGCDLACSNATCASYCESTAHNRDCTSTCTNASECTQQCVGADRSCQIATCSGGSDCTLDCADTATDCRVANACESGSSCDVTCDETAGSCSMTSCTGSSRCDLACSGSTGRDCVITSCDRGSTCNVDCSGAVKGKCGIASCTGNSTCNVSCDDTSGGTCSMKCARGTQCTLDCGAYRGSSCSLQCTGGSPQRCGTTNTWVCPGTPCP